MFKTFTATPSSVVHDWYIIDAKGKTLGRLATEIARRLRGKHKPEYTPNIDTGDYIIVVNADKLIITGRKGLNKMYHHHTGYIGNLKSANFQQMQERRPGKVLEIAVKGMLPKGPLGRAQLKKLKIYAAAEHEHAAQQPIILEV